MLTQTQIQQPVKLFVLPAIYDNVDTGVDHKEEVGEVGEEIRPENYLLDLSLIFGTLYYYTTRSCFAPTLHCKLVLHKYSLKLNWVKEASEKSGEM